MGAATGEVGEWFGHRFAGGGVQGLVKFFVVGESVDAFDEVVDAIGRGFGWVDGLDGLVAEGFVGVFKPFDGDIAGEFVFAHVGFDAIDRFGGGDTDADGDFADGDDWPAAVAGEGLACDGEDWSIFAKPHFVDGACVEADQGRGDHVAAGLEAVADFVGVEDVVDGGCGVCGDLPDLSTGFEEREGDAAEFLEVVGAACFFERFFALDDGVEVVGVGEGSRSLFHQVVDRVVAGMRTHRLYRLVNPVAVYRRPR